MVADLDRDLPVLMIDSLMLFEETLEYQRTLAAHLGLRNVQRAAAGGDGPGAARSGRHAAPARHRRLLRRSARCAARPGAAALAGVDHRAEAVPGGDARGARGLRGGRRAAQGQSAGALAGGGASATTWTRTTCRGIRWWPRAIRSIGCCAVHHAGDGRARTSGPGAGAAAKRSNAAFTSARTAASCARRAEETGDGGAGDRGGIRARTTGRAEVLPFDVVLERAGAAGGGRWRSSFPNDRDPADLAPWLDRLALIRVAFPASSDGRGFSIAAPAPGDGLCRPAARGGAADRRPVPRRRGASASTRSSCRTRWRSGSRRRSGGCGRRAPIKIT